MEYRTVTKAEDVTEEIMAIVTDIVDGWFPEGRVDWECLLDRADGSELDDGTFLDFGEDMMSPAIKKVKRLVREYRRNPR